MKRYNAVAYLTSAHGHLKELEEAFGVEIVCFEVHPEGVYIQVPDKDNLDKIQMGGTKEDEPVANVTFNINEVEYQFYTFDRKE